MYCNVHIIFKIVPLIFFFFKSFFALCSVLLFETTILCTLELACLPVPQFNIYLYLYLFTSPQHLVWLSISISTVLACIVFDIKCYSNLHLFLHFYVLSYQLVFKFFEIASSLSCSVYVFNFDMFSNTICP